MRLFFLAGFWAVYSIVAFGQACDASFTQTVSCNEVSFQPNTIDSDYNYTWDFGDGETSDMTSPTHEYTSVGDGSMSFTVTLTVNSDDCDESTNTQGITVQQIPDVNIENADPVRELNICRIDPNGYELCLDNLSSTSNTNYSIDFGDPSGGSSNQFSGTTFTNGNICHTFINPGLYSIQVTIVGTNGCSSTKEFDFFYGKIPGGQYEIQDNTFGCLPAEFEFFINDENDFLRTSYIFSTNDGSDSVIFEYPLPDNFSFTHIYNQTSCDTSATVDQDTFPGSFQATITVVNPCGARPTSGGQIYIDTPPTPDFSMSPDSIVCERNTITFMNTSDPGVGFDDILNDCTDETNLRWSVSPTTGWSLLEGSLQNAGTDLIDITFQVPGIYDITLNVNHRISPSCGQRSITKQVCIIPIPESSFNLDTNNGCAPQGTGLTVNTTNTANTLMACGPETDYTWLIGYEPGECGTVPGYQFLNRSTSLPISDAAAIDNEDVRIRFDSTGIYTLGLVVMNTCGVDTFYQEVTVSGAPKIDITPIPDSCFVETYIVTPTLSFDADCFSIPTYEWAFQDGNPSSFTGESPPAITYDEPGDYTISLTVQNGCGETVVSERFELFPLPSIPNIQVTEEVCVGGTITATNPPPPDPNSNMYSWTGPNGFTSTDATWTIENATTANAGTYTLTVTDQNGCTVTKDFIVNVTLSAPIQINPDPATVCLGEDLTLTASGGIIYDWEGDHLDGNSGPSVVFNHDVVGEYQVIVIGSDPAGQCDGSDTIIVNVVPLPVVVAGDPRLGCVDADFNFQTDASPLITAGTTGIWSGDNITSAGIFNVDTPGEYTVTYTFTDENGCSDSDEATICIRDRPEAAFTLPENFGCAADGLILRPDNTSNTVDDCDPATYLWAVTYSGGECNSGSGASSFVEGTNSGSLNPAIQLTESGEYILTLTISNDCGVNSTMEAVTVGDLPTVVITEVTDKCGPQPVNFSAGISACNSDITTYAWDFPTANPPATSALETPPPIPFPVGIHTVTLAVTNACGATTVTEEFEVLEGPMIDISLPRDSVCVGDDLMVSGNSSGTNLTFNWTGSHSNISFSNSMIQRPIISFTNVPIGPHSVTVTVGNSVCDPVMTTFNVYVNDEPEVTLDPIGDGCGNLSFSPGFSFGIPTENVDDVLWELDDGSTTTIVSTAADPGEIQVTMPGTYTLTLTATNICGTSTMSQSFRVLEGPDPSFNVDNTLLCRDGANTVTLTDASSGDIEAYAWTVTAPNGQIFATSSEPSPTFTFNGMAPLGEYDIEVLLSNSQCMPATPWDTTIMLNATPTAVIDPIDDQCTEIRFTPSADFGEFAGFVESVLWTFPAGSTPATSTDFEPEEVFLNQTGTGLEVNLELTNRCGTTTVNETFNLLEGPSLDVSLDTTFVCRGGSVVVTNNSMGDNLDFTWSVSPSTGVVIDDENARNPTITFNGAVGDYEITAEIGNDLCDRLMFTQIVEVSDAPVLTVADLLDGCGQTSISPQVTYGLADELIDSVRWQVVRTMGASAGAMIYSGGATDDPIDVLGAGTYTFTATAFNRCAPAGVSIETSFRLYESPTGNYTTDTDFVCRGTGTVSLASNFLGDIDSYNWTVTEIATNMAITSLSSTEENPTFTFGPGLNLGDYTIAVNLGNAECNSIPWDTVITLSAVPANISLQGIDPACNTITFDPTPNYGEFTAAVVDSVRWTFPPGSTPLTSIERDPGMVSLSTTGIDLEVRLEVFTGCGSETFSTNFDLLVGPVLDVTIDTNFVCQGEMLIITNNSVGDNLVYTWSSTPPDGVVFSDPNGRAPTITFNGDPGDYTIMAEIGNPICGNLIWDTIVRVSAPVTATLADIDPACDNITFTPEPTYSLAASFVDSVRWTFPPGSTPATSTDPFPGAVSLSTPGIGLEVRLDIFNGCGTETAATTFDLLVGPVLDVTIDTNFVCQGEMLAITNNSAGDNLVYTWSSTPPDGVVFSDLNGRAPTITFNGDPGDYTIMAEIGNPICGNLIWDTIVRVSAPVTATLADIDPACDNITFTPEPTYSLAASFVDSVRWTFPPGSTPATSTDPFPGAVSLSTPGIGLEVRLDIFNGCGTETATTTFDLLVGPVLDVTIDTNFVCRGEMLIITNNSVGDNLVYTWSSTPPDGVVFSDLNGRAPTITFNGDPGDYTIMAEIGNPICGTLIWDTIVRVSAPVTATLADIDPACDNITFTPEPTYSLAASFVDSVRWTFPPGSNPATSTELFPGEVNLSTTGLGLEVQLDIFNGCGTETVTTTFNLLVGPVLDVTIDTNFVCQGEMLIITNNSAGDNLVYLWSSIPPDGVVFSDLNGRAPTITFNGEPGDYTIMAEIGNPICGTFNWDTVIRVSAPPEVSLDFIPDFCEEASFLPSPVYNIDTSFMDSVRWTLTFEDSLVYTSNEAFPDTLRFGLDGSYSLVVTAYNGCGSASTNRTFNVLEGPDPNFTLSSNFVCIGDTLRVEDMSTGDGLLYNWMVDEGAFELNSQGDSSPYFVVLGPIGTYDIRVTLSNTVCTEVPWIDTVRVSERPTVMIEPIPDFCDTALVSLTGMYSNETFIDSVGWEIRDGIGTLLFSSDSLAPAAAPLGVGRYTVRAAVFNECGSEEDSEEFRVFAGPMLDLRLDTARVCLDGSPVVTIENNSTGDSLSYRWTVTPGGQISDPSDTTPTITFSDTGLYVIVVEVSNPVCNPVFWTDTVLVLEAPELTLAQIGDFCGEAQVTPMPTFNNFGRIDSLRWYFPGATDSTSTAANPGERDYLSPGTYTVSLVAWNDCGQDSVSQTFRVLEPIEINVVLDTNLGCGVPFAVTATNETTGDDLDFEWSVTGTFAATVVFDDILRSPVFNFQDTGIYVLILRVSNEICGEQFWRDTVEVIVPPLPLLVDQTQFCEEVSLTPVPDYQSYRIDSVRWEFPGSTLDPASSTDLFPENIPYSGAGTYIYSLTAYNICGATTLRDTFIIDTIPEIILGPTDTICITDGLFTVPAAMPTGGIWRDSLGRPGVITEGGIFNPVVATGGVWVIEYVYTIGACEVITQKDIFVVDLSDVAVVPDVLNACVTETQFILNNGTPGPGWYTGPGVTDSLGVMDPSSLTVGTYTLIYYYQAPGTNCIETREFTVNVRPLPVPDIRVTDSICVNVPVDIFHAGSGATAWQWTVEDSTVYTTENIVHAFLDTGFQTIQLISTSEFGCQDSISREIYVSGPPIVFFTKDTTMGCALLPVNFDNESIGFQFVRYGWDFGNGETSTEFNPSTLFYDQGNVDTTYYINLAAINACGEDSYRDSVIVFPNPKAFLDVSQDEGCTPLYVEFLNITSGLPDRFEWYIDGALYSTDSIAPDRSFIAPDSMNTYYEVMLIAYNECGIDTARRTITVLPDNVRAFFSVEDQVGCEPFDVQFRNFSDPDTLVTFDWFFGDGSTSQLKNPLHTFRNTSDTTLVYEVTLVADNGCGQDSIMIPITVNPAPQVSFTAPPITCARDTVFFTNTSEDVTNPIWVFGDGDTLTMAENPGHVFMQPGNYTVELTAFAIGTGCPNTWTETINIRPIPVANASAAPLFGCPPLEVNVNNLSIDADFYFWDYGDGNTSVGPAPLPHAYAEPGIYDITLTASDEFGCGHDSVVATIQVYEVPVVNFITEPERQCGVPTEVCFENNSENGGDYRWDFGNGQTSGDNNPCVTYETSGDYVISLVATNEFLCETRTEIPISVYGIPVANFSIPDSTVCEVATVTFTNTSQEAEFAQWIFSDGFVSNAFNVTRTFTEVGIYGFTLIVGNGSGCSDTLVTGNFLEVNPSPIADFDLIDRPDRLPTTIEFTDLSSSDAILFGWDFDDGTGSDEMNPVHRYLSSFDKTVVHWVENEFGCTDTIEMVVDLDTLGALYIPNIFTPEDASTPEKDIFKPKGIGLRDYYIAVYTRNGQIVWESDMVDEEGVPEESWDGTFQGQLMPPATYLWRVHRASFFNGRPWRGMEDDRGELRRTGYVTLVR
jgi:PKD repeat protein